MKKLLLFLIVLTVILGGCVNTKSVGGNKVPRKPAESSKPNTNMGIISNNIKFEVVNPDSAPLKITGIYQKYKEKQNVVVTDEGNYTYIIAMMGQKNTGGYTIKVMSIEDNEEGKLKITIKLTEPDKDSIVTQVITYPVDIVRIPKTNLPIYAVDTKGNNISVEVIN